jgi:hypothetical protein
MAIWHHVTMAIRPMSADERDYLTEYKTSLEEALRGFWITLGLFGLPLGFLLSTIASGRGWHAERIATVLAGAIMVMFVGLIVAYSPRGTRSRRLAPQDLSLPGRIEVDLLASDIEERPLVIESKLMRGPKKRTTGEVTRRFFIRAGGRELEVTGLRWMNLAAGQELELSIAPRSNMLLAVAGLRERLPMPTSRRNEPRVVDEALDVEAHDTHEAQD